MGGDFTIEANAIGQCQCSDQMEQRAARPHPSDSFLSQIVGSKCATRDARSAWGCGIQQEFQPYDRPGLIPPPRWSPLIGSAPRLSMNATRLFSVAIDQLTLVVPTSRGYALSLVCNQLRTRNKCSTEMRGYSGYLWNAWGSYSYKSWKSSRYIHSEYLYYPDNRHYNVWVRIYIPGL